MLLKILFVVAMLTFVLALIGLTLKINSKTKIRILMIGDSYTFKNNMPSIFQSILGDKYQVDSHVIPKWNLTVAYNDKNVKNMIINGKYNFVILQEHSARIIMATKSFKDAVHNFITLIKNKMYIDKTYKIPDGSETIVELAVIRAVERFLQEQKLIVLPVQKKDFEDSLESFKIANGIKIEQH